MRLLNVRTRQLEVFFDADVPHYTVLSHTWTKEELSYQDYLEACQQDNHPATFKAGWQKIEYACLQTLDARGESDRNSCEYTWIDTICIDKTSSAELSEAINSMFRWYSDAEVCYAYLQDVPILDNVGPDKAIRASRWFTRGWTLQELIAPREVLFFSEDWQCVGKRTLMAPLLSSITSIDIDVLLDSGNYERHCVATKMSWTRNRQTSRKEDMAYCMLGLFDINMPLLYGEGDKAFIRLQEEIIKANDDTSIFAWNMISPTDQNRLLAPHPGRFTSTHIRRHTTHSSSGYSFSNAGLAITLPVLQVRDRYVFLDLGVRRDGLPLYLWLRRDGENRYIVSSPTDQRLSTMNVAPLETRSMLISRYAPQHQDREKFCITIENGLSNKTEMRSIEGNFCDGALWVNLPVSIPGILTMPLKTALLKSLGIKGPDAILSNLKGSETLVMMFTSQRGQPLVELCQQYNRPLTVLRDTLELSKLSHQAFYPRHTKSSKYIRAMIISPVKDFYHIIVSLVATRD